MIDILIQTLSKDVPVPAAEIDCITARFHQKRYRRGDILLSAGQVPQRFLDLSREQPELLQRVPQRYVAQYLGMTPESLSRIKKRLMAGEKS
ncbi:MAG: hypothetical protein ACO1N1_17705 [Dyadobacter fermentans]